MIFRTKYCVLITFPFYIALCFSSTFGLLFVFLNFLFIFQCFMESPFVLSWLSHTVRYAECVFCRPLYSHHSRIPFIVYRCWNCCFLGQYLPLPWFILSFFWILSFPKTSYVGDIYSKCLHRSNYLFICLLIWLGAELSGWISIVFPQKFGKKISIVFMWLILFGKKSNVSLNFIPLLVTYFPLSDSISLPSSFWNFTVICLGAFFFHVFCCIPESFFYFGKYIYIFQ